MTAAGGRRKTIIVDRGFQWKGALVEALLLIGVALVVAFPAVRMIRSLEPRLAGGSELAQAFDVERMEAMVLALALLGGLCVVWIAVSVLRSHRVAGPIVKITRHIHDIAAGRFDGHVELRSGDELQALARALNDMTDGLTDRQEEIRTSLLQRIDNARRELQEGATSEFALEALDDLADAIDLACASGADSAAAVDDLMRP